MMDIQALCQHIGMPASITDAVLSFANAFDFSAVQPVMQRMMAPETGQAACAELSAALDDDPKGIKFLTCQLHCACEVYESYRSRGIGDEIFYKTMGCFTRFVIECSYYKGEYQFDRGWWTWRQLSMRVFRLGQLEYELRPEGTVSVHIPSDTEFTPPRVRESLSMARKFLSRNFPEYRNADFTCRSWLLSPTLAPCLDADSNILHFQSLFELKEFDPENMDYIPWLFQTVPGTPVENYPHHTMLQRRAKEYLLIGGKIGIAYGILKR